MIPESQVRLKEQTTNKPDLNSSNLANNAAAELVGIELQKLLPDYRQSHQLGQSHLPKIQDHHDERSEISSKQRSQRSESVSSEKDVFAVDQHLKKYSILGTTQNAQTAQRNPLERKMSIRDKALLSNLQNHLVLKQQMMDAKQINI